MASGSCSSSSSGANPSSYDVFLSFRGEDTRYSFTAHLYEALRRAGFCTFKDDEEIPRGEELKPEIETAIKRSRASVVVLSENYATSTWCLEELWLILEQKRKCNHFVLPVFYHVNPSDVRKHNNTFVIKHQSAVSKGFPWNMVSWLIPKKENSCGMWTDHNVNRWKAALMEIADLTGFVLSAVSGPETNFLTEIVDAIYNKVDLQLLYLPPNLIGMDIRVGNISSWLERPDAQFLAVCGMGGSGKTTLAMYILNSSKRNFENISFLENIGSRCKEHHGLLQLQEQLLNDISGGKHRKIPGVSRGTNNIVGVLQNKKALVVLDDIDEEGQLVALLGTGKINPQSKIILTTRVYRDEWFESRSWRCQEYKMKLLNGDESLELLSHHAFGSKTPREGFKELAVQAVQNCEGNPLALEVLGSSLSKKNTTRLWKSELNLLEREIDSGIQRVLIRSYNSLPYDNDKELFLHIACFFVGKDMDYVVKILEPDYSASSRIQTLIDRCLLSVSTNKKLMMHRLLQEMGRTIVRKESEDPAKRSRVWRNEDSYALLGKEKGSKTMKGLALDMQMLVKENYKFKPLDHKIGSLRKMDNLKLVQLNFVNCSLGTWKSSEHLRWLCWLGFPFEAIPYNLYMGKLVAIDMSYSNMERFEPPEILQSLQILNLKDSHDLLEIRNISRLPNLETLILWNCQSLIHVCETIGGLESLALLNMTGCEKLHLGGGSRQQPAFSLPRSLEHLFLKDCNLERNDYFPPSLSVQSDLKYLNLANGLFEFLPDYTHLTNLRVLDLSCCSRLKLLLCLPNTLAELYIYYCESLEKITFQSGRFTLQEFGYEGCFNLSEIEGFIKLVPIAKLDETDLGHMKWLKQYQNCEVCLAGDDELTFGRSCHIQMLYEFNIMSTSLPRITDPNITPQYTSESASLSFDVPLCPKNRRLIGLNVTFKYKISGKDWAWFSKIKTSNGVDMMYNPKVFGKPGSDEVGIWLSYWPIGNRLNVGDKVNVSIVVMSGLEVLECGANLVYTDDEETEETSKDNMDWVELSEFKLSTGAYYLCRRDFFELMNVGRLTPRWFEILVGDAIDYTEVRGWRKTGRPQGLNPSFTELKTVRCIIHGPQSEEIYKIAERSKSSFVDTMELISSTLGDASANTSKFSDASVLLTKPVHMDSDMSEASVINETMEFTSISLKEKTEAGTYEFSKLETKDMLDEPPVASSSSSSTLPSSWEIISSTYDVYLSHGRFSGFFASGLYTALRREGLEHIKDNVPLFNVGDLSTAVKKRISNSRASIIVLSENYAQSSWCLNQLLFILERRRNSNHIVFPVFYRVEPSDVRKHKKRFSLQELQKSGESMEKVNQWKTALTEVANLSGYEVPWDSPEEIARAMRHALYRSPVGNPPHPTEKVAQSKDTK